jgi:predicted dienelactone hydrolase
MYRILILCLLICVTQAGLSAQQAAYDPMALPDVMLPQPIDISLKDADRDRDVPIRVYLPASPNPAPVILFSHGLGGARTNNGYLGVHWAKRGYAVIFVQHPGSDESVWKNAKRLERLSAMKEAASGKNLILRIGDVSFVLNQLTAHHGAPGHALQGRLDLSRIGMSGHSFGAVTTQAVSGQSMPLGLAPTEPRIRAAVMMSPSVPGLGNPKTAFGKVQIPWLLLTGTNDDSPIGNTTPKSRLLVFPALPDKHKYELVLDGAEHSAFSERALPFDRQKRNPNHHRAILATSTAFFDAHLKGDVSALAFLEGDAVRAYMDPKDRWQRK